MARQIERRKNRHLPTKRTAVFYHGSCNDGFGGAWAAWKKFGNKADYVAMYRGTPVPDIKNKEVYFIDYTLPRKETERFIARNRRVTCIDHHITAKETVMITEAPSFSLDHSGAVLAWNYFHPRERVPLLLKYIEDRDLWRWKMPKAKAILSGTNFSNEAVWTFKGFSKLVADFEKPAYRAQCIKDGEIAKSVSDGFIEKIASQAVGVKLAGIKALAVNAPEFFSSGVGNYLVEKTGIPFVIIWQVDGKMIRVSLRSGGKANVAKIAEKFGGGGHERSAGFRIKNFKKIPWK
ncbi:MAG: Phosphoesterase, DHHA1 [Parcubacteria group bacterium LiPW_15]|nr:MAG: Phosphoesterase, DHHA1 [Parcubacteria group bacterium LiPW_15]